MSKPEWGIKRVCPSCNIKYYDFNKTTIICPKCEFEFDPDLLLKSRKGRSIATKIESNTVSTDTKKEEETLEAEINELDNDDEILEIDDETDVQNDIMNNDIKNNVNEDNNTDVEIIDDDEDEKDNFSIEIDDVSDNDIENEK